MFHVRKLKDTKAEGQTTQWQKKKDKQRSKTLQR